MTSEKLELIKEENFEMFLVPSDRTKPASSKDKNRPPGKGNKKKKKRNLQKGKHVLKKKLVIGLDNRIDRANYQDQAKKKSP